MPTKGVKPLKPIEIWRAIRDVTAVSGSYDEWLRGQLDAKVSTRSSHLPSDVWGGLDRRLKAELFGRYAKLGIPSKAFICTPVWKEIEDAWTYSTLRRYSSYAEFMMYRPLAGETLYAYRDLPELATKLYLRCAVNVNDSGINPLELRFIDKAKGNYYFIRFAIPAAAADFVFGKVVAGVETVIATQGVDLANGTWYEIEAFLGYRVPATYTGNIFIYRDGASIFRIDDADIPSWDRFMFYIKNTAGTVQRASLGCPARGEPFILAYEP